MLITKEVEVKATYQTKEYYKNLGYEIVGAKPFLVKIEHLSKNSHVRVEVLCDYCKDNIMNIRYQDYNKRKKGNIDKDCCNNCRPLKNKDINLKLYGVENVFQLDEIKKKSRETCLEKYGKEYFTQTEESKENFKNFSLEKYGVENLSQSPEIINKIKKSQFDKYGMYYSQTEEYKEKYRDTCLEIYGCENAFQNEEIKEKAKKTCIEKYGVEYPQQNKEIKQKTINTLLKNGTTKTSKQQLYLNKLFNGNLNYNDKTTGSFILDIAFPEDKIYIEYNGGGHDLRVKTGFMTKGQFQRKEMDRYYFLKRSGWKQIKIESTRDYLPLDEILLKEFNCALDWLKINEKYHSHYDVNIGELINDEKYGHLRFIKDKDLE